MMPATPSFCATYQAQQCSVGDFELRMAADFIRILAELYSRFTNEGFRYRSKISLLPFESTLHCSLLLRAPSPIL